MYKIAVMGDRDSIYGFAALGLDTFPVSEKEEAGRVLKSLAQGTYAVIYMTEACVAMIPDEVERYASEKIPAILPIPGVSGNTGKGIGNVKKMVEQAVGSDIIFNNNN
jgi:V/A-type H+/Na+-transporting ATPase subunit F